MARKITESIRNTIQEAVQAIDLSPMEPDSQSNAMGQSAKCGAILRATREEQNLTIQEVATRLRLSVKQIEALEADRFDVLPEPTIVRGFIRNYAKQLKIAAEPLLEAYSIMVPSSVPHEMIVKPSANMKMTSYKKPKTGLYGLAALAVLIGLGIWFFYQNYVQKPSPTKEITNIGSNESANVEAVPLPLPEPALPMAEREGALQASTELALPPPQEPSPPNTAQPENASATVNPTLPATSAPAEVKTPAPQVTLTAEPTVIEPVVANVAGMGRLEFSATQETWVNVIDGNGQEVYSKTIFAGSREAINAKLPVDITVGNAGATSLSINGKSYDLAPYSRNNVAHIKLEK